MVSPQRAKLSIQGKDLKYKLFIIEALIFLLPFLSLAYIFYRNRVLFTVSEMSIFALILLLVLAGLLILRQILDGLFSVSTSMKKAVTENEYLTNIQKQSLELNEIATSFNHLMHKFEGTTGELKQRIFELHTVKELYEISTQTLSIDELLNALLDKSTAVSHCHAGAVFLIEPGKNSFRTVASKISFTGTPENYLNIANEQLAHQIVRDRKPLLIENIHKDPRTQYIDLPETPNVSFLSLPIFVRETMVAVITLSHKTNHQPFEHNDQNIVSILIDEIGSAIEKAYLHSKVKKHVIKLENRSTELAETNQQLQQEVTERQQAERELQKAHEELEKRVSDRTLALKEANTNLKREIEKHKRTEDALRESERRYKELSITDNLTRIFNSRHFFDQIKIETERFTRYNRPLSLLIMDIDDFKKYNDRYGHMEGDRVLARLGSIIKESLRMTDSAYRYGGEEFTVLLPETEGKQSLIIAERIREAFAKEPFSPNGNESVHISISIGVAEYHDAESVADFIKRADKNMYIAKSEGKNRIHF